MTLCGWIILSERNLSDTIKPQLFLSSGGQALSVSYAFYMKSQFWFSTMHHYVQSVWENEVRLTYMHNKILTKFDQLANSTIINISVWHLKSGSILAHIRYNSNTRTEYRYWRLRPHPIFASTSYLCCKIKDQYIYICSSLWLAMAIVLLETHSAVYGQYSIKCHSDNVTAT